MWDPPTMWAAQVFSALNSDKEFAEKGLLCLYHSPGSLAGLRVRRFQ